MSQENVEAAQRGMEDVETFAALLDDYVVFDQRAFTLPDSLPVFMGKQELLEALRRYWGAFDDYRIAMNEIIDAGQSVVIVLQEHGRGKGSGVSLDRELVQVWAFSRRRIVRVETYRTRAEALEAAGLRE